MIQVGLSPRLKERAEKIEGISAKPFEVQSIKSRRATDRSNTLVESGNGIPLGGYGLLSPTNKD